MKTFGGPVLFLDRSDINTDEIIPAKYLTEITKEDLKPYILEDLRIAAQILKGHKLSPNVRGILSPATPHIQQQAMKEGLIDIFMEAGFCVTNPTCGACLGMSNGVLAEGEVCASTTNRNFMGRMGKGGMVHLMSPATAAASAIEGKIADPRKYL